MSDNQVTLVGNLTDDPELRPTPTGLTVASFRLAVNPRVWDGTAWRDGEASFFRVNVWREQAEHVSRTLTKGARCVVVGRLRSRSWETPEGQRRSAVEVEADEVAASLRFAPAVLVAPTRQPRAADAEDDRDPDTGRDGTGRDERARRTRATDARDDDTGRDDDGDAGIGDADDRDAAAADDRGNAGRRPARGDRSSRASGEASNRQAGSRTNRGDGGRRRPTRGRPEPEPVPAGNSFDDVPF